MPETYVSREFGGVDWGVTFLHRSEHGGYQWPLCATDGSVTALSLGLPVGVEVAGGPVGLARQLLAGVDIHRDVVPPFGLVALDGDQRFAVQQDWIGMCRLFTGTADGITAFCSRPGLLAAFLHGSVEPDLDAWGSYAVCGNFGGDYSPVRGARLLRPGERVTGQRRAGGGWDLVTENRYSVDDVVLAGYAGQGRPLAESLDLAAESIVHTAGSISELFTDPISMGLSGGKDSRLIAASLIAAGRLPRLSTNEDTVAEGEVACELVRILREKRGMEVEHRLFKSGAPANVLKSGLRERTERLQRLYDYQFPATFLVRAAVRDRLGDDAPAARFSGAAGELSSGYWYPADGSRTPEEEALARLMGAVSKDLVAESAYAAEHQRITGLLDHAKEIGLSGLHLIDYIYLVERVRRWYTSAYSIGSVTPFLSPGFVAATFGLTAEQKRERLLHNGLIARLVPEWAEVPFVSVTTGRSTATRIWEGDGVRVIADLVDTAQGPIARLIRRDAVEKALTSAVRKGRADQGVLRQFTYLAVASEQLEPKTVGPVTTATYTRVTAPPAAKPAKPVKSVPWLRRTRLWRTARRLLR
ncbi:hypothetical protein OHA21_42120 [Actinoplanes sp. NBC_00393]|uniref:hypothetical protein n=1 Tax=Actinoplanes sp. NBC_00393 TaxID=2975953 RepID=UPI002E21B264